MKKKRNFLKKRRERYMPRIPSLHMKKVVDGAIHTITIELIGSLIF